jgi:hypothetical protein
MDQRWYYLTVTVQRGNIEHVLNNLEQLASGMYEIVSIVPELRHNSIVMVVVRLRVVDGQLPHPQGMGLALRTEVRSISNN